MKKIGCILYMCETNLNKQFYVNVNYMNHKTNKTKQIKIETTLDKNNNTLKRKYTCK